MPKYESHLKTRIGTCRSGTPFDVPHHLEEENIKELLTQFNLDDLVDIFCMTEAIFSRHREHIKTTNEWSTILLINQFLRREPMISILESKLTSIGLTCSPNFVAYGTTLLLG